MIGRLSTAGRLVSGVSQARRIVAPMAAASLQRSRSAAGLTGAMAVRALSSSGKPDQEMLDLIAKMRKLNLDPKHLDHFEALVKKGVDLEDRGLHSPPYRCFLSTQNVRYWRDRVVQEHAAGRQFSAAVVGGGMHEISVHGIAYQISPQIVELGLLLGGQAAPVEINVIDPSAKVLSASQRPINFYLEPEIDGKDRAGEVLDCIYDALGKRLPVRAVNGESMMPMPRAASGNLREIKKGWTKNIAVKGTQGCIEETGLEAESCDLILATNVLNYVAQAIHNKTGERYGVQKIAFFMSLLRALKVGGEFVAEAKGVSHFLRLGTSYSDDARILFGAASRDIDLEMAQFCAFAKTQGLALSYEMLILREDGKAQLNISIRRVG